MHGSFTKALPLLALSLTACGSGGAIGHGAATTPPGFAQWLVVPGDSATEASFTCTSVERALCDAIDNDCNGQIDEGCRTSRGEPFQPDPERIQIAATWNTGADLDLVVTGQDGSPLRREIEASAVQTGEGDCGSPQDRSLSRLERLSLPIDGGQALQLRIHSARDCNAEGDALATVSVLVPGGGGGAYNVQVSADGSPVPIADLVPQPTPGTARH